MKRVILICLLVTGATVMSFAQAPTPAGQAKMMGARLKLNDVQITKLTAIYQKSAVKKDSILKASNGDMDAARPAMISLHEAQIIEIKAILTDDQKLAFDKFLSTLMPTSGGGAPPPGQH
jgi:protein CpxP